MKPHFQILDGLRGVAAIVVVIYHLLEAYYPNPVNHPIHHGYLAVDFFYLLSGFVIGYAYDDRWKAMSVIEFLKIRLVRLHPLVILGVAVGMLTFLIDPYTNFAPHAGYIKLVAAMFISFTLLPSPDLRGGDETHSLDGTCWSLLQEYIANLIYAIFGRTMGIVALSSLVAASAVTLVLAARVSPDISAGWDYHRFWMGGVRVMFPFFAGLLLFRIGKQIKVPMSYAVCSIILLVLFTLPAFKYNGMYEAACVIIAFPLIVAIGAGGSIQGRWAKFIGFLGALSYPLYIIHYPFIYMYTDWVHAKHPTTKHIEIAAAGLFVLFIILAWAALKFYDEPVRAWLKRTFLAKRIFIKPTKAVIYNWGMPH